VIFFSLKVEDKVMGKKVKIVGVKKYIDPETGEEVIATVEVVNGNRKYGWEAIWLSTLLETLEVITNKGFKVVKFLLSERIRNENLVVATIRQIAKATGLSEKTVRIIIKKLLDANFITRVQKGVYRVNPAVIWRGNEANRQAILIKFGNEKGKGDPDNDKQKRKGGNHE
jgi:predicted transcriptional regulator